MNPVFLRFHGVIQELLANRRLLGKIGEEKGYKKEIDSVLDAPVDSRKGKRSRDYPV